MKKGFLWKIQKMKKFQSVIKFFADIPILIIILFLWWVLLGGKCQFQDNYKYSVQGRFPSVSNDEKVALASECVKEFSVLSVSQKVECLLLIYMMIYLALQLLFNVATLFLLAVEFILFFAVIKLKNAWVKSQEKYLDHQ